MRGVAGLLSAAVLAGLAVVAFRAVIGPAFVSDAAGDPASWTFFERLERLAGAEAAALETGTLAAWQTANRIG